MDKKITAVLIDTVSIQNYIFSSNKLKENIGASYLVSNIYKSPLIEALNAVSGAYNTDIDAWKKEPQKIKILKENVPFEIGYIGGGNALILFERKEDGERFIRVFTKILLSIAPGIRTAFGIIDDFSLAESNFSESMEKVFDSLSENKNRYFPQVTLRSYGFTSVCPSTSLSSEAIESIDSFSYESLLSSVAVSKLENSYYANIELERSFSNILENNYTFTDDLSKLGQKEGKYNFIAVVHIDGNNMGQRFRACKNLEEFRMLSISISNATRISFTSMLETLIKKVREGIIDKIGLQLNEDDGKILLPIRPIIIGGDDITFVSEGRLGIWLAEIFMKAFSQYKDSKDEPFSSCGGVAIVKTKYPFFRAYKMASFLTNKAKDKSRKTEGSSYLDFFVSSGGWVDIVDDSIEEYYRSPLGNLHFGPYRVDSAEGDVANLDNLKYVISKLKQGLPRNKVMGLREVLYRSRYDAEEFMNELSSKGYRLPELPGFPYHTKLWVDKRTPYFDAIELLDFYPEVLYDRS